MRGIDISLSNFPPWELLQAAKQLNTLNVHYYQFHDATKHILKGALHCYDTMPSREWFSIRNTNCIICNLIGNQYEKSDVFIYFSKWMNTSIWCFISLFHFYVKFQMSAFHSWRLHLIFDAYSYFCIYVKIFMYNF